MFQDPSVAVAQKTQTEEFQKTIAHLTEQITKMATLQNQAAKPKPQSNNGNQGNQKQNFGGNSNNSSRNITCYNCRQLGHTSRFCQMPRQQQNYNRPLNYGPRHSLPIQDFKRSLRLLLNSHQCHQITLVHVHHKMLDITMIIVPISIMDQLRDTHHQCRKI